ncbi:heme ABC transporter ATP-binding protein [Ancylobacter terrae]|uniref:heme ABC transporter ATP-binding protein n=1 Tax=Ancylobacter sp. sgz301288 TaxID=3342077 RepID=UPI0038592725
MYAAEGISVLAGRRALLDGVSVTVVPGSVTVVVGPNGAGKSTLLKVLAGESRADAGRVTLDGVDIRALGAAGLARRRAVLAQSVHVAFPFTVAEIVAMGLIDGRDRAGRVGRALARVDLGGFAGRFYGELSGGEKQRVQIARALAQLESGEGPGYLLLDEPTASLDLAHQLLVVELARAVAAAGGGVLAVLHDLNLAAMAGDHILALKDGCEAASGAPDAVLTDDHLARIYGVPARVGVAPGGVFVLPQSVGLQA